MKYNPELHHRRSIRLRGYDYAKAGAYFVTICCQERINYFGDIENDIMILNDYGNIARNELAKTPEIRTNVELGEFIVMPNHIHAIIRIMDKSPSNTIGAMVRGYKSAVSKQIREFIGNTPNLQTFPSQTPQLHTPKTFNDVSIWQRNYWDHIIRNDDEYAKIAEYIRNNPVLWGKKYLEGILNL